MKRRCAMVIGLNMLMVFQLSACANPKVTQEDLDHAIVKHTYESIKNDLYNPDSLILYSCELRQGQSIEREEYEHDNDISDDDSVKDLYYIHYQIAAKSKRGNLLEEEYLGMYNPVNGEFSYCDANEYEEYSKSSFSTSPYPQNLLLEWDNLSFYNMFGADYGTDYTDYIDSDDFEKLDSEKILSDIPDDLLPTEMTEKSK